MSIVTARRADMCYCPGCSHGMVLEQIGQALDALGRTADNVCIVSDIGCIGTADRYFSCHTFHGLHGRSITYAEGIKRVRPDLLTLVLIGDGGCGIGTGHLVHAARRNADIKVILCNNFNFGMTGGQHSPTTPLEARTTTTPRGASEHPFDVCATVAANGAAYVARGNVFDAETPARLLDALRTPGFVLVDVWELCTAYFVPANRLNRAGINELSEKLHLPFGVVHRTPPDAARSAGPAVEAQPGAALKAPRPSPAVPPFVWTGRRELCVSGSAGQRIRSAVGVVGEIAVGGGLYAAQQDDFPITVRKGFSLSNLIISSEPIRYAGVDAPDLALVLSAEGGERMIRSAPPCPTTWIVADEDVVLPGGRPARSRLSIRAVEKRVGKESAALAALCACLIRAGLFEAAAFRRAAEAALTGAYRDDNLSAINAGVALSGELLSADSDSYATKGDA